MTEAAAAMASGDQRATEALRQRLLLATLARRLPEAALAGWLGAGPVPAARGLQAYRANAAASAQRALAAAYPSVARAIGDEALAALARRLWHEAPPLHGDLALWGDGLPALIAAEVPLADWPWLADLARLDWALHRAAQAADGWFAQADLPPGLSALAEPEAVHHQLLLQPGLAVLRSSWPVVALWQAHPWADTVDAASDAPASRVQAVEAALARGAGECAAVGRRGWQADVQRLSEAEAGFMLAVLDGRTLGDALEAAGEGFDFASWLQRALQSGWIIALRPRPGEHAGDLST